MNEERYKYLNSLPLDEYDRETTWEEQMKFCEYQAKYHKEDIIFYQVFNKS